MIQPTESEIKKIELWARRINEYVPQTGFRKFMFEHVFDRFVKDGTTLHNDEFHEITNLLKRSGIYFHPDPDNSEVELYPLFDELVKTNFDWLKAVKRVDSQNRLADELDHSTLVTNRAVRINLRLSLLLSGITLVIIGIDCNTNMDALDWQKQSNPQKQDSILEKIIERQLWQDSALTQCLVKSIYTDSILIETQKASKETPPSSQNPD